jgi:aerobic C4-dicarboxylate transport protein
MSVGQQIALAALMILTSKGAAGITGAGLVTLTASLQAFGRSSSRPSRSRSASRSWSGSTGS